MKAWEETCKFRKYIDGFVVLLIILMKQKKTSKDYLDIHF